MIRRKWLTFTIAAYWFAVVVLFGANPSVWLQLASVVATLALLVFLITSAGFAVTAWKVLGLKALIPLIVCIFCIPAALAGGRLARMAHFALVLPELESLVADARKREIPPGSKPIELPSSSAYLVLAERTSSSILQVEFLTGGGFPAKHTGYLYVDGGTFDPESFLAKRWPYADELRSQWFSIAD